MADFDNPVSSLLCEEDEASCFNKYDDSELNFESSSYSSVLGDEFDAEFVEKLVQSETRSSIYSSSAAPGDDEDNGGGGCLAAYSTWLKYARLNAVDWIFNTRSIFGFGFHTAYLSVIYFDWFLSKRSIDDGKLWAIKLLSVACLSLAAKMEECKAPVLSEYSMEDYCFENKVIQKMELLVLNTLEWKLGSISPFSYLHFFINKISGQSRPKETFSRAVELVLSAIKEINLLDYRPSIIAVAAVLAALDNQLTRQEFELKLKLISSLDSLGNERIFSCYIIMQEIEMGKLNTPKQVISPTNSLSSSSAITLGAAAIKRRLTYSDDSDQNSAVKKICHQP